jgi:ribonuclease HI
MCSLCSKHVEFSFHIFFECDFAVKLWSWFANCINLVLQFNTMEDMWKICDMNWSPRCKVVIKAAMINLINCIWYVRNQVRFHNNIINWKSAISLIIANTTMTGNNSKKVSSNSIRDFTILKSFKVTIHHTHVPEIKEILWQPPMESWLKCNIDGAYTLALSSCGGVFRNHEADFILGFAEPLNPLSPFHAELSGALRAIELAHYFNWKNLWLETDSSLVVSAFTDNSPFIPWNLRKRWHNSLHLLNSLNCIVTHIYREGNTAADLLANHGLSLSSYTLWWTSPPFLQSSLDRNHLGIPNFRVCNI